MPNRTAYTEGKNNSSVIEGDSGKKYCPNDSRLLIYRSDIQRLFCVDCGFTPDVTDEESTTSDRNNNTANNDSDIWIIPMTHPRSELTRKRLMMQGHQGWDQDMQRMQGSGFTIKDSNEIVSDSGTYSYSNSVSRIRRRYY